MRGNGGESAVFANAREGGIFFRRDEGHVIELELEVVDGFLDKIGVALANMLELRRGNAHEEHALLDVAEAGGLEPGVERLTIDFLFQCAEDAHPRVEHSSGGCDKRH